MFCKHCGKEIKDGVRFCPKCGKPTGVTAEKKGKPQNKKPNPKLILAIIGVVVLVFLIGGIGKKISSSDHTPSADVNENSEENQNDYTDKKWKKKRSYKKAYKEEYNSFDARMKDYYQQRDQEYEGMVDDVAEELNEAYESLEKAVPNLSGYIGAGVGNAVADSNTGREIVSALSEKAVSNEKVRKIGFKTMMYAGTALYDYAVDYTTTEYPFGFSVLALNEDYALLRSNGTYEDMQIIIRNSISPDDKIAMLEDRIAELENMAVSLQEEGGDDDYAECMGRIAANKDREKEVNELYNKCMAIIACSGNGYCLEGEGEIKLYWVVGKDGTVFNTFWAPAGVRAESWTFDISIGSNGYCLLEENSKARFVIDRKGNVIFEGNSFEQREDESVGESIICTYGPSGNVLRETKVKDSTNGTYYTMELVDKKGKAKKLLDVKKIVSQDERDLSKNDGRPDSGYYYEGGSFNGIKWGNDMNCSDYALLRYLTLEDQEEEIVIELSTGKMYSREEIEEPVMQKALKEKEEDQELAQSGTLKDGWLWDAQEGRIFVQNSSATMEFLSGLSASYSAYKIDFNAEALNKNIGESREIAGCYCKDNVLWVVTKSGYFYTCDLEGRKKTKEVEIGENAPLAFTPYGLAVKVGPESDSGEEAENSVYQYDASGKCIAKYPIYSDDVYNLYDNVCGFLYCNGKDAYNLATQEIFSME